MRHADYDLYYDYIEVEPDDQEQLRELEKREVEYGNNAERGKRI